jgi:hypothetical protein
VLVAAGVAVVLGLAPGALDTTEVPNREDLR